jgi:hypothetical protein
VSLRARCRALHRELVLGRALQAGQGRLLASGRSAPISPKAEEMAGLARQRSLKSMVGLQGRSDPTILYARDLIQQGYIGEVSRRA